MLEHNKSYLNTILIEEFRSILANGNIGIEREGLRVKQSSISSSTHSERLGSALCNSFITTDFSEALMELITPPLESNSSVFTFLNDINHFVNLNIGDESIWPISMPPYFVSEAEIPIANYGSSNEARFKMLYREGLSNRYGRKMQAIAGIHFNYSFVDSFWKKLEIIFEGNDSSSLKETFYFRAIRNLHKMNWLILYFFGASPVTSSNFISASDKTYLKNKDYLFLPYATSLRMSDLGYQNSRQSQINISLNSLKEYSSSMSIAMNTRSDFFSEISIGTGEYEKQINSNLLQIEDEYYAVSRPKSNLPGYKQPTSKLMNHGIDYIELRSLDLNPFAPCSIDMDTINFLEMYLIFSAFSSSALITSSDMKEFKENDLLVATQGRDPQLKLKKDGSNILLKDWANLILDEMSILFDLLNNDKDFLSRFREKVNDPDKTLSGRLLDELKGSQLGFHDFFSNIALQNKNYYLNQEISSNISWDLLIEEAKISILRQKDLEAREVDFKDYLDSYFSDN